MTNWLKYCIWNIKIISKRTNVSKQWEIFDKLEQKKSSNAKTTQKYIYSVPLKMEHNTMKGNNGFYAELACWLPNKSCTKKCFFSQNKAFKHTTFSVSQMKSAGQLLCHHTPLIHIGQLLHHHTPLIEWWQIRIISYFLI